MSKFKKLNEEEIKIDVPQEEIINNQARIIMRNEKQEDFVYFLNRDMIKTVCDLKNDLRVRLKLPEDKDIKMFFKGRPFKDENEICEFKLSTDDVILYMVADIPKEIDEDNVSELTQNVVNEENVNEPNLHRGFNRFRNFGLDMNEIHFMRMIFHTAHANSVRRNNRNISSIDWSPQAVLQREEDWVNSEGQDNLQPRLGILPSRRVLLSPSVRLHQLRASPFFRREREEVNREPNSRFFLGFIIGIVLNLYAIIFLLFCRFSPKFKLGLQLGMLLGLFLFLIYNLKG